jgi:hypothetical protein
LFSSLQNSEGGGDCDSGDSFADPCQFLPFPKTKILLSAYIYISEGDITPKNGFKNL